MENFMMRREIVRYFFSFIMDLVISMVRARGGTGTIFAILSMLGGDGVEIRIPLRQHIGGINKPIVKCKDKIYRGQLIAIPDGLGANVHSSVSGEVIDVYEEEILIEAYDEQPNDYIRIKDCHDYLESIKEAGIVGAGGAGFPTHIKLNTRLDQGFVVVNAAECEPLLGHNMARIWKILIY